MSRVVCFGEALIDFLDVGSSQDGILSLKQFRQFPGGAPANAAVAIAKLGGNALFAGQVGDDNFGHFLRDALDSYGVNTELLLHHPSAKTALAFVSLDESGDRSFSFYRDDSADLLFPLERVSSDWFSSNSIFHICSNTLTTANMAKCTLVAVNQAKENSALTSFDVNLRHNLWHSGQADISIVNELVFASDIVKFSLDELDYLAQGNNEGYLKSCLNKGVKLAIVTDGANPVTFYSQSELSSGQGTVEAPSVIAVDTTAAGDSFIGALLFALSQSGDARAIIEEQQKLTQCIEFAVQCGAYTVTNKGAFPALPNFDAVKQYWPDISSAAH